MPLTYLEIAQEDPNLYQSVVNEINLEAETKFNEATLQQEYRAVIGSSELAHSILIGINGTAWTVHADPNQAQELGKLIRMTLEQLGWERFDLEAEELSDHGNSIFDLTQNAQKLGEMLTYEEAKKMVDEPPTRTGSFYKMETELGQ